MRKTNWTKRDPIKNYFPLPNENYSLRLWEDRKTYQCLASYRMIGEAIGKCVTTVRKYVGELEERQLIRTEKTSIVTRDGRKQNGCLRYTILPIQLSLDQFYQRQMAEADLARGRWEMERRLAALERKECASGC